MLRMNLPCLALASAAGILLAMPAGARVLTLSAQGDSAAMVRDAGGGSAATNVLASPQGRLLVGSGLLAADAGHDLLYVGVNADPIGPAAGTPGTVLVSAYGATPVPSGALNAPAGRYFTALAFDASTSRLVGVVSDATALTTAVAQVFTATTSNGTAIGLPNFLDTNAGCCRFSAGIAAWRASTHELFMVGRRNGDSTDQLLRFDFSASSPGPDAYPITDERVAALAIDSADGSLYAIARSVLDVSHLARVTYSTPGTPATLSAIGSAPADCCYVASGPATIDGVGSARALFALTRNATTPGAMRLSSFNLASGAPLVVNAAMDGYGLWTDPAASLDRIFANGFE